MGTPEVNWLPMCDLRVQQMFSLNCLSSVGLGTTEISVVWMKWLICRQSCSFCRRWGDDEILFRRVNLFLYVQTGTTGIFGVIMVNVLNSDSKFEPQLVESYIDQQKEHQISAHLFMWEEMKWIVWGLDISRLEIYDDSLVEAKQNINYSHSQV